MGGANRHSVYAVRHNRFIDGGRPFPSGQVLSLGARRRQRRCGARRRRNRCRRRCRAAAAAAAAAASKEETLRIMREVGNRPARNIDLARRSARHPVYANRDLLGALVQIVHQRARRRSRFFGIFHRVFCVAHNDIDIIGVARERCTERCDILDCLTYRLLVCGDNFFCPVQDVTRGLHHVLTGAWIGLQGRRLEQRRNQRSNVEPEQSVIWAIGIIGAFYLMTLALGFGAAAMVGGEAIRRAGHRRQHGRAAAGAGARGPVPGRHDRRRRCSSPSSRRWRSPPSSPWSPG